MKKAILTGFICVVLCSSYGGIRNWQGDGISGGNNGTDFNSALNWVEGSVPTAADTAIMTLDKNGYVTFSSASTTIGSLIITLSKNNKLFTLDVGSKFFIITGPINGNVIIGSIADTLRLNVGNSGAITYGGNATFGAAIGNYCEFAYSLGGTTGKITFNADLTINRGARTSSAGNLPAQFIFNGVGNQTITDNGGNINFMSSLQINASSIVNLSIASTSTNKIQPNDITIFGTLIIPSPSFAINRSATGGGTLLISPGGILKLGGNTGGIGNSNFPANYNTVTLDSTSTVEFNGAAQTIPQPTAVTIYGNLTLSGSGIKTVGGDISINRALDIGLGVTMFPFINNTTLKSYALTTAFVNPVNGTIDYTGGTGRFVVERYLSKVSSWRLLATPMQTLLSGDLTSPSINSSWREGGTSLSATGFGTRITGATGVVSPTTANVSSLDEYTQRASMKYYNMAANVYVDIKAAALSAPIARDEGYYVFVRGDRAVSLGGSGFTNLRITGKLRTGNQIFTVGKNVAPAAGFQSVGNPFASRIDVRTFILLTGGVNESFYIWNPTGGYYGVGQFEVFAKNGSNFTRNGSTGGAILNTIESGQAVFLQNNSTTTDGSITIKESDKGSGSSLVSRPGVTSPTLEINLLTNNTAGIEGLADGVSIYFDENNSNSLDNYDVRKINNSYDNIGIKQGAANLVVESRKTLAVTDSLRLNIGGMRLADYKLQIDPSVLGNLALNAFLIDKFLQTETAVSLIALTIVPFSITSNAASSVADRFMIVFRQAAAAPLPFGFTTITAERNAGKTNTIKWTGANEIDMGNYSIERSATPNGFAAIGTSVATGNIGNNASYTFVDAAPIAGVSYYRVKATARDGQVFYSDVVKVVNNDGKPLFAVQPNPVVDKMLNIHFDNIQGSYSVKLVSKQGATVFNQQVTVSSESEVKNILVGNVAAGVYEVLLVDAKGKQLVQTIFIQ